MAKVISIIGYAGELDKSWVTMALAEFLSGAVEKRVLVIDVGGAGWTTGMLVGDDRPNEMDEENIVPWLIRNQSDPGDARFDFRAKVQRGVSNVRQAPSIDLLPSSRIDYASDLSEWRVSAHPTHLLWRAVRPWMEDYDVVLIDCPRDISFLARNALHMSDGYIPPADSTFKMPSGKSGFLEIEGIHGMVHQFSEEMDKHLRLYGMVISGYVPGRRNVVKEQLWHGGLFGDIYWSPVALLPSMNMSPKKVPPSYPLPSKAYKTLRQKWGKEMAKTYARFAKAIHRFEGW